MSCAAGDVDDAAGAVPVAYPAVDADGEPERADQVHLDRELVAQRGPLVVVIAAWCVLDAGRVLSTRIVRTVINGRDTYRLQLVIDGHPTRRHPVGNGRVSLDMGPSQIAVAVERSDGTSTGWIEPLADRIRPNPLRLRRQQRHLDRQHRTGTPDCFKPDGTDQSGRCQWERSHAAKQTTSRVAEQHRRLAEHRQTLHGAPVNRLLSHGADVVCEKLLAQCARSGTGVAR